MANESPQGIGHKGRFYLTKHIWVPQEPIENLNLKMSDMILRRMPKLPLGGDDAAIAAITSPTGRVADPAREVLAVSVTRALSVCGSGSSDIGTASASLMSCGVR